MTDGADGYFEILTPPQWTVPLVFNSPHSGHHLPASFLALSCLGEAALHASEDNHVDELFIGCLAAGAPMLKALISRSYIDLNREPYEFDARMFQGPLPSYMNIASSRVACGLGTIPKTVGDGINIYAEPLDLADALQRVESIYRPYHRNLAALLDEAHRATGQVLLIDCHSMPSTAITARERKVDVVLGDRYGASCDAALVGRVESHLTAAGLKVARNKPYAGGFITECHGRPRDGRHALQIELNRALYMDEKRRLPHAGFKRLQEVLNGLAPLLAEAMADDGNTLRQAAE